MKKPLRITLQVAGLLVIALPFLFYGFVLWSIRASGGTCEQMVIDSNEWASGIDIPAVTYANCYYNEIEGVRTAVYRLDPQETSLTHYLQRYSFEPLTTAPALQGEHTLADTERIPEDGNLYRASGQKNDQQWQYVLDAKSGKLWVEIWQRK